MGKLQSDKMFVLAPPQSVKKLEINPPVDTPPQIPPRMKKKGPALPEKPPHIRAKTSPPPAISSQPPVREPLKPRTLNLEKFSTTPQREVLVAASKSGRERPVEKRQREPAKLLMPTSGAPKKESSKKDHAMPSIHLDDSAPRKDLGIVQTKTPLIRLEEILPKRESLSKNPLWSLDDPQKPRKPRLQPVLLIPRNLLAWGSTPISYTLWTQRDLGRGAAHKPVVQVRQSETSGTSTVRLRSGSVTRSGSLTSQGSSSSDSGGETFPKSVLKKQRRAANNTSAKGSHSTANRRVDQKKNVTFNAFATVQLMEE